MPEEKKPTPRQGGLTIGGKPVTNTSTTGTKPESFLEGRVDITGEVQKAQPKPAAKPTFKPLPAKPITGATGFKKPAEVKTTAEQNKVLVAASKKAVSLFPEDMLKKSAQEAEAREQELKNLSGKSLDVETLFTATKYGETIKFGNTVIENKEQLEAVLADPAQRSQFYNEKKTELGKYFNIISEKDFDTKIGGGLSEYEKIQFTGENIATIYDPVFTRQTIPADQELGYRQEFDQFAPDPINATYKISQRNWEAQDQFNKLKSNGVAVDAYGQPFQTPKDFYTYLQDPLNRDAYQRKYGAKLKEIGYSTVNDLLKPVVIEGGNIGALISRSEDYSKMRIAKGSDVVKRDFIGKSGTVFDENPNAGSISNLSEEDLGRVVYEYELGNEINIDVPYTAGKGYNALNKETLVELLTKQGLRDYEIDEIVNGYKVQYERSIGLTSYENKRKQLGFYKDAKGVMRSKYDENRENQALSELSEDEKKISSLYDQIQEIYASAPKLPMRNTELGPEQLKKVQALKSQIEQIKRDSGFFGFNAIPQQEFFDVTGNRLEGKDKEKAQQVFVQTMQGEKKTDRVILKEKRNVLYEQVEELEKKLNQFGSLYTSGVKPIGSTPSSKNVVYRKEGLNERYQEAVRSHDNWLQSSSPLKVLAGSDEEKANYIYATNLRDKIIEKKAQIKALNKIIYTNADLTKIDATGVTSNLVAQVSKGVTDMASIFTGDTYLTPVEELTTAVQVLQENGMYVNPDVVDRLKEVQEDQAFAQGLIGSVGAALQIGMYGKPTAATLSKVFTSQAGVAARAYMASRYGRTGIGAFQLFEKAATVYGVDYLSYELSGLDGSSGVAERLGTQAYDKATGVLQLGRFVPNNIFGKMFTVFGRAVSGAAGSFTEETFSNVWGELKQNGFDITQAVENAYGKTEDQRLFTLRSIAFTSLVFSTLDVSNIGILFKSRAQFAQYLESTYGENISETDREILDLLDSTIKNARNGGGDEGYEAVTATVAAIDGRGNATMVPVDQPFVMSSGPVESDQKTTTSSFASSGAGSEGVQVEKRTGNMGEEFYVSGVNGVVDNKVIYRYNSETGQLEAKGLTSTTEEFVPLNQKTADYVESQSKEHGIVSREKVENIAIKNLEDRRKSQAENESSTGRDNNKVSYQNTTETSRRKKERIQKVEASANARYNPKFDADAQARTGLFTGVAEEVKVDDTEVKDTASEISRNMGSKMKINLTSFFMNGKAVITELARKKAAKVADYMAPLFRDFDDTLFTTQDTDMDTGQPVRERNRDAVTDKVREAVARNTTFNEVFGKMVSDGRMSKEDAIDNFIVNLLQNSRSKVSDIFGNDKTGFKDFQKLRKDFNNFVANKYTGSNTFSATEKFVRQTPMSTATTKNRKADYKKQAADLIKENQRRREVAEILQDTQEEGAFVKDEQIDAARFLSGEITAQEFMENTGESVASGADPVQVEAMAKAKAAGLVDMNKYNEAVNLIQQNDATREKYKKELLKKGSEVWEFVSSMKKPFQWKQNLRKKRFFADVALRQFESQATRAGITLQQFMDTRIEMLKRTEEQFQDWLKMSPNLVPLYQGPATLVPAEIYPNMVKAMQLKEKKFSPEKIALMTGVVLNEQGEAIAFDPTFKISDTPPYGNKTTLFSTLKEVFYFTSGYQAELTNGYAFFPKKPTFGKRTGYFGQKQSTDLFSRRTYSVNTRIIDITSAMSIDGNQKIYDNYPDIGLMKIRVVDDVTLPQVSFSPNHLYTGNGKSLTSPGEILINVAKYTEITENISTYNDVFKKSISPQIQKALRQSIQFMENELVLPEATKFATPTAIRAKVLELKSAGTIDENTEKLINDVVEFYVDKNIFQFGSYASVFNDISKVLFLSHEPKTVAAAIATFSNKYDLTEADSKALELMYNNYIDAYGPKGKARLKSIHNAFVTTNKFAGLNSDELIVAGAEPVTKVAPGKTKADTTKPTGRFSANVKFTEQSFEELAVFVSGMSEILEKLAAEGVEMYEYFDSLTELETINDIITKEFGTITEEDFYDLTDVVESPEYKIAMEFLQKVFDQEEFTFDDGNTGILFTPEELMRLEAEGFVFPDPVKLSKDLSEKMQLMDPNKSETSYITEVTDAEARNLFYQMFPGIADFANGIYDPYKKASDFTKQELQAELVDKGLVSQERFDEIYSQYENNPDLFTGSAASNFVENLKQLTPEEQKSLRDKIKIRQLVEKSIGTSFYSNTAYAATKVIEQSGSKNRIALADLKGLLTRNGAKTSELDWLDIDDFIESNKGKEFISSQELMDWASNIHGLVVYDPETMSQKRTVTDVLMLGFTYQAGIRAKRIEQESLTEGGDDFGYSLGYLKDPIAVKKSDGTVELISLDEITSDSFELYEKYVSRKEYTAFKKALDDLNNFNVTDLSDKNKQHLKSLVKIYVELKDEMYRTTQLEEYEANTTTFPGSVNGTYKEHLITIPFSSNKLLKNYNDKILDVMLKLSEMEKSFESKKPTKLAAQEMNQLENQLDQLVATRDSLSRDYYNSDHFTTVPSEVMLHLRTQIVLTADGERVLYLQEVQSDKIQGFRKSVLNPLKEKYSDVGPSIIQQGNALKVKAKGDMQQVKADLAAEGYSDAQISSYLAREEEIKAATAKFKKTTPITESGQFAELALKHAMKIASDYGVRKIAITNGHAIGPKVMATSRDMTVGINTFYNKTLPSIAQKLSSKFNFKVDTLRLERPLPTIDPKTQITLSTEQYPVYFDAQGQSVINTGRVLEVGQLEPSFLEKVALDNTTDKYIPSNLFNTIELTEESLNKVAEGMALFQKNQAGAHGATVKTDQGKHIIFALTNPNITTAMHELAHVWESSMTATERQMFMDSVGHSNWTKETSEAFARGFEKYLYDGKAPSGALGKMFEDFKRWLLKVYGGIKGTPVEMEISEPMRKMYDAMLGEARVNDLKQRKSTDIFDDISEFIKEIKANPEFEGVTDSELYAALMRSGFEPSDVQDYFSLKQRANIAKQQQGKGMFKDEADVMENEEQAMRVVRSQKELIDEIENMDPIEYPVILQTLFDAVEDGDVPLAKAIKDLIAAKQRGANPKAIAEMYSSILKAGTGIGRMLQLFRQLTKDTYLCSAEGMFIRNEKKGLNIPEKAKQKIRDLAVELDKIKELYKQSRAIAESDPYGISSSDPSKTNLQYHTGLYEKLQEAAQRFTDARQPYEGDDSLTDMYRSFVKGGLMTPGSIAINTLSNVTKFITNLIVDPLKSAISLTTFKLGISEKQFTKTSLKDWWSGVRYGMPLGIKRAYKILKDGTISQAYQNPDAYVQGYSFYKSFAKFWGLKLDQMRVAAGYSDMSNEELAEKHGFKINMLGEIPIKEQAIAALQGLFGVVPDIVFRVMGATDAVFRDFAYFSSLSEQFKFTKQHDNYQQAIKNATSSSEKARLKAEYDAVRKAYIEVNSDFQNSEANKEAMRYVYANDNFTTDVITKVQRGTREIGINQNSLVSKVSRLVGTGIIPFTRIPSNYALELLEFFLPEYALMKLGTNGYKAYTRSRGIVDASSADYEETLADRRDDARSMDRVLARALVGTGIQFIAKEMVMAGAVSGAPDDENEDKGKSMTYSYVYERPYSINLTLVKERFKEMFDPNYKSKRNELWDKETDFIIDYRALGIFGAALYIQYKESKLLEKNQLKFQNRGDFEKISEDFTMNLFGNYSSAGKYILDQTFVRGLLGVATVISSEDENRLPAFLADVTVTLSSGMVPNSLSWIDKWRRKYMVDYDAKEAPAFKAMGIKVEDNAATLYWYKLATKMAERWPVGDPRQYVDLPFVQIDQNFLPVKYDAFGKPVLQTPTGSLMGSFLYNTFDVFKATRAVAGYDTPDWEALCYLATKKGGAWECLPTLPPRSVDTPSGAYKFAPEEYNNYLQYSSMITRKLVQQYVIDSGLYKNLIDVNSSINKDARTGLPIMGDENINILMGYQQLGSIMADLNAVGREIAELATYTFVSAERRKMYQEDPERYTEMYITERLTPIGPLMNMLYDNQNIQQGSDYFKMDMDLISNPDRFKDYAKGAMKLFKEMNEDPKTAIITGRNEVSSELQSGGGLDLGNGATAVPFDEGTKKSPAVETIKKQRETVNKQSGAALDLGEGVELVPFD
jgi:hypothetical protein